MAEHHTPFALAAQCFPPTLRDLLHALPASQQATAEELRRTVNTLLGIDEEISRKMREETIALLPGGEAELEKLLVHFPPAVRSVSDEPQHE